MTTDFDKRMRDAAIEFGSILYGASWRERLAEKIGVPKRILDDHFTSDNPLPQKVAMGILRLMQEHLDERTRETQMLSAQIATLREGASKNSSRALSPAPANAGVPEPQPTGKVLRAFAGRRAVKTSRLRAI